MGLFDGAFDPQTYGGQGIPGWLSSLLQNPQIAQSLGQSAGFSGAGVDVSSRNRAQPPDMSGGLLPSIPSQTDREGMAGYSPMSAPMPGGAPLQPQMQQPMQMPPMMGAPQPPPPQTQQQPQAPQQSAGGNIGAGIMGFLGSLGQDSFGGAIQNAAQGFSTGQSPQNQTHAALIKQGIPAELVPIVAKNPQLLSAVLQQTLGTKKTFGVIGKDKFGNDIHGFIDTAKETTKPATMEGGGVAPQGQGDPSLSGQDFLNSLDKGTAAQVSAMLEGRMAPPSGMSARSPYWQKMLEYAASVDPSFNLSTWQGRVAGNKDFYGGGKSSEMVRAANQTIHHVGELIGSMDKLNNTQSPQYNAVGNYLNTNVLGKGAVTEFLPNAHAVAEEMSKVFKGANLSDAEIRQWERSLGENMSPEQQRSAVGKLMTLLNGSLTALETKRRSSLGDALSDEKGPLLDKESQHTLEKVNAWIGGKPTSADAAPAAPQIKEGATATHPNGSKVQFKGGKWVPLQ